MSVCAVAVMLSIPGKFYLGLKYKLSSQPGVSKTEFYNNVIDRVEQRRTDIKANIVTKPTKKLANKFKCWILPVKSISKNEIKRFVFIFVSLIFVYYL